MVTEFLGLGNLTSLTRLSQQDNKFEGRIPPSLRNCQNLHALNLSSNNLNGTILKQVIGLSSLSTSLVMSCNFLIGALPLEVHNLKNLAELDLSKNRLSSEIPTTLGSCLSLKQLCLEGDSLEGSIPQSLDMLRGLIKVALSRNNLYRNILEFLSKF